MLEVCLLGKFEVRLDGQPVEIPSRPAQSLLAYLILSAGTSHRREKLAGFGDREVRRVLVQKYEVWKKR